LAGGLTLVPSSLWLGSQALAQDRFPTPGKQFRFTVPFPAGASTDYVARVVGQKLAEQQGLPVIVENKTGASGNIAADYVAKTPADGYNLLFGAVSLVTNPTLYERPPYIPEQLVPVGVGIDTQLVLVARADFGARTLKEVVAASAAKAGGINAASAGTATLSHLGWEILAAETRVAFNHVPYRGSAPALTDLIAGQADVMIESVASASPYLASGKLKAIAVLTPRRLASMPNVPTAAEQGFKSLEYSAWNGFMAPAQTPAATLLALNGLLAKAMQHPDVSKGLLERSLEPVVMTPANYLAFAQQEARRWTKVIKDGNVKL
jgi:tripartite-type tricarboxylate transporter receptor subunit TctC